MIKLTNIIFFLLSVPIFAYSEANTCSTLPVAQKFYQELKLFAGKFQLGSCQIELHLCEYSQNPLSSLQENLKVADLLVKKQNKIIYVPIMITPYSSLKYYDWEFKLGRALYYKSSDKHPDPYTGEYEYLSAWIVKAGDRSKIEYIEVNQYQELNGISPHQIVCGTDREIEKGLLLKPKEPFYEYQK